MLKGTLIPVSRRNGLTAALKDLHLAALWEVVQIFLRDLLVLNSKSICIADPFFLILNRIAAGVSLFAGLMFRLRYLFPWLKAHALIHHKCTEIQRVNKIALSGAIRAVDHRRPEDPHPIMEL